MCTTKKHLDCISSIKVDNSECLQQCSGTLITSYNQEEYEDVSLKKAMDELVKYMSEKDSFYHNMANEFQGHNLKPPPKK